MHFKFVVDTYFNSFAAYFTTSVYTEGMGGGGGTGVNLMGVTSLTPFASCLHFPFQMIYHLWDKEKHCSFCYSQLFSSW